MKIVSIIGARPQFIKCAPLSHEIRKSHEEILVHTGQHYDFEMSKVFFQELNIPEPDYNLGIGSGLHGEQTGRMLIEIEKLLVSEQPDFVLVYGDTNSTLAGALAASKLHIKLAHVEAGLRSFDRAMPEEINRLLTDNISDLLFCPTRTAVLNLKNEGVVNGVNYVGDVMMDALEYNKKIAEENSTIMEDLGVTSKEFILATVHRPSNTDCYDNLYSIVRAFCDTEEKIIFPIHPRTKKSLKQYGLWNILCQKVKVISPIGYLDMLSLLSNSFKIVTDSGGIQKESYMLGVPCITLRKNTEWIETVEDGQNILVGSDYENILRAIKTFDGSKFQSNVFGDGNASSRISKILSSFL
jgi:UDP-N-acetylglucosamine 2-epimerase (non-hydrolysing)